MDESVLAAMRRWPDVPAVTGWLSLTATGQWCIHEGGTAQTLVAGHPLYAGSPITNTQLIQFIGRNYSHDTQGRWFFQNGPQRVYVRLDAAPLILRTTRDKASGVLGLCTHTDQQVDSISSWWLDEEGRLFADTPLGPALVAGRDTADVLDHLFLTNGKPISDLPWPDAQTAQNHQQTGLPLAWVVPKETSLDLPAQGIPLYNTTADTIPTQLGFAPFPTL